jgi:hypothetical protein
MENEENTEDFELEIQPEETVDAVEETEEPTEDTELTKAQAEAAKYRRLWEKSQKKPVQKPQTTAQAPQTASPNIEEVVLLANGMDEGLMEQLKKVAAVQGTSLIKAQNDPIFVAVKEKFESDLKKQSTVLPVSRGSGQMKPKKDFKTPGLTAEEHRAMVEGLH